MSTLNQGPARSAQVYKPNAADGDDFHLIRLADGECYTAHGGRFHGPTHLQSVLAHCHTDFVPVPPQQVPAAVAAGMHRRGWVPGPHA